MNAHGRTLAEADDALARWRERLAAASRNVVELSELPAFLALKAQPGTGRTAEAARGLVATMDELWQGVLLIGGAIDRAAAARQGGSRLWGGEEAATEALAILEGESVEVATGDLPVLNRGLLAAPRASIRVTPQRLLEAMEQAFERAKTSIDSIARARETFDAARAELAAMVAALAAENWPGAAEARARLDAARQAADPLGAREAIEALRPTLLDATQRLAAADRELAAARAELAEIETLRQRLDETASACAAATDVSIAVPDGQQIQELAAWLDRLARTRRAGQLDALRVGLSRWRDLAARLRAEHESAIAAATATLGRRDELRGRFGALRAKQAARAAREGAPDMAAEAAARALQAMLFGAATKLREAERLMSDYEAALARPAVPHAR
jgi:hypothetical protein